MTEPRVPPEASSSRHSLVPFFVLVGVVIAVGLLFFQVVQPLILPLFLAGIIAMLARPLHERMSKSLGGRDWLSALLLTLLIVALFVAPLAVTLKMAVDQLTIAVRNVQQETPEGKLPPFLTKEHEVSTTSTPEWLANLLPFDSEPIHEWTVKAIGSAGEVVQRRTTAFLSDLPGMAVGIVMFLLALYFFLKDGHKLAGGWEQLTPLDLEHDRVIRAEFVKVCRGVVWGTLMAAVVQAVAFAIGFSLIDLIFGIGAFRWVFLLSFLTVGFAMIPFFGATAIWLPTGIAMLMTGHTAAGITMLIYGGAVVSTIDNVVKIWALNDAANMHPLLAFVCVFGGIQLVGVLGIFIGPIVGAVLVALLRILKSELIALSPPKVPPGEAGHS